MPTDEQYGQATEQLEGGDNTGTGAILEADAGLPSAGEPQQSQQPPTGRKPGMKLKHVVDGKEYEDSLAGDMEWLSAIQNRLSRTDFKSPYEVTIMQKALQAWMQEYGDGHQVVPNGVADDRTIAAVTRFQNLYPTQMKLRQKAANRSAKVEDYVFDQVAKDERDLFG
ncbi:hypothetical protein CMI37_23460 [Candidatus Pacearchaeota archaeon]|nr:hypothetical protein [Candidatus Pacearchaeota archaeon]|tara:strand:+ start:474 stop:977 length:504 start_codon:yes stop_codon:yes gene_type:complete